MRTYKKPLHFQRTNRQTDRQTEKAWMLRVGWRNGLLHESRCTPACLSELCCSGVTFWGVLADLLGRTSATVDHRGGRREEGR